MAAQSPGDLGSRQAKNIQVLSRPEWRCAVIENIKWKAIGKFLPVGWSVTSCLDLYLCVGNLGLTRSHSIERDLCQQTGVVTVGREGGVRTKEMHRYMPRCAWY